jgi:hypothetical protein
MSHLSADTAPAATHGSGTDELGQRLLQALASWRIQCLSLHNAAGEVLWLSQGVIGPDEHGFVLEALDVFALEPERQYFHRRLEDHRHALFLAARDPFGGCCGIAFVLLEGSSTTAPEATRALTPQIKTLLKRFSALLAPPQARKAVQPVPPQPSAAADPLAATGGQHVPNWRDGMPIHARKYSRLHAGNTTRRYEIAVRPGDPRQDTLVVERVIDWLATHRQRYISQPASFVVPISSDTVLDGDFAVRLGRALHRGQLTEGLIGLSLPATAWTLHPLATARLLTLCERLHCHGLLDDFALHGHSLELLRSKAVRMLKIDAQLTATAMSDRFARATLAAITHAARVLGLHCVAKGAPSAAATKWLAAAGIDYADRLTPSGTGGSTTKSGELLALEQAS